MSRPWPLILLLFSLPAFAGELSGLARVVDGDTIVINSERIRLEGIDAPETKQVCTKDGEPWEAGKDATRFLRDLTGGKIVVCRSSGRDKYRRLLATCFIDGQDLNALMVLSGWAVAYRKYSTAYVPQELTARENLVGIWAGECAAPEDWRHPVQ